MAVKEGACSSHACAACKYQRRKCTPDCPLAPFFPADHPKLFQNAHRLFGVSNILKILNKIKPSEKTDAMKSILYEANVRELYPVHGCYGVTVSLEHQIHQTQLEFEETNALLRPFREKIDIINNGNVGGNVGGQLWAPDPNLGGANGSLYAGEFAVRKAVHGFEEISVYDIIEDGLDEGSSSNSPSPPQQLLSDVLVDSSCENELKNAAACFTLTNILT